MPSVSVGYNQESSHDISLSDGSTTYGLIFYRGGIKVMQEIPLSPPAQPFNIEQQNWVGGRGRTRYIDDPTGFNDSRFLWSTTEGKLFPSLQWRFADGIRTNHTTYLPGNNQTYAWWGLYGSTPASKLTRYLSTTFTPATSYTATRFMVYLRRRGTPGTLTFEVCSNNAGDPGTPLSTITKTVSDITDTLCVLLTFSGSQALTASTAYHLKIYGAGTDSLANHWEVLTNDDGTTSKYSTDNSAWTGANVSMYYRVTDAATSQQWRYFDLEGAKYAISQSDAGATPVLKINGVRGTATSATSTSLVCTALTMSTNQFQGARIRILDGTGDGQTRPIVSNDSNSFTVATWDITPSTDSRFIVYETDYWTTIASHGVTKVTGNPCVADKIGYIPQGTAAYLRRMRVNASTHDFAADGTNTVDVINVNPEGTAPVVYGAIANTAALYPSATKAWGADLAWSSEKYIGTSDYRILNLYGHNKVEIIFKEDGVYTYSNNVVEKLGANFDDVPDRTTGLAVGSKDNFLWFGWAHSLERMAGSSINDMMNWKLGFEGMGSENRGWVSSIASAVGWLFFSICGDSNNYSTIWCWNGYGFHQIFISPEKNQKIRNISWQGNLEGRPRLWFDLDGDMAYIEFPQYVANPLKDSSINYMPEGVITTSTYDGRDPQLYKILTQLRIYSEQGTCEVDYQTNANVGTSTWSLLGTADSQPVEDLTLELGGVFQVRFRLRLQSAHSRTPNILTGWQLTGRMMPLDLYQWICTFRAETDADTFYDETDHNPSTVYSQLQTWARNQTKLTLRSQSQSVDNKSVTISFPSKSVDWVDGDNWGGRISVALLET